ncbi:MAG: hypothetical protein ACOH2K_01535 [Burkholderiaceae bacterium]
MSTDIASLLCEKPSDGGKTVAEALLVPFEQLTLRRQLPLFKNVLSMTPGAAGVPNADFLVILLEGAPHQTQLRSQLDADYKNLENMLRGLHAPSATTLKQLQFRLGVDDSTMRGLVHGNKEGHLMPAYVQLFQMLEGLTILVYKWLGSSVLTCPCCKGNMLDDMNAWWRLQPLQLAPDAYGFVDRLLKTIVSAEILMRFVEEPAQFGLGMPEQLIAPSIHPIGQWMEMVRSDYGFDHLWQITTFAGVAEADEGSVSEHRIRKWRSGMDLLPLAKARAMIIGAPQRMRLDHALIAARVFALAIDVVRASADGFAPTRSEAQLAVSLRFAQLKENMRLSINAITTHVQTTKA